MILIDVLVLWVLMAAVGAGAWWATGWHRERVLEGRR